MPPCSRLLDLLLPRKPWPPASLGVVWKLRPISVGHSSSLFSLLNPHGSKAQPKPEAPKVSIQPSFSLMTVPLLHKMAIRWTKLIFKTLARFALEFAYVPWIRLLLSCMLAVSFQWCPAMLLLNVEAVEAVEASQLTTNLAWSFFRVLRCQANGEPILVPAYLVQLGQHMVASKPSEPVHETLHESAACIKPTIAHVAPLQSCMWVSQLAPACGFPGWRPCFRCLEKAMDFLVLQGHFSGACWHLCGQFAAPRVPAGYCLVLCCSARGGILVEPRTLDAKDHHLDFQVVWMPKTDKGELFRLQQCTAWACPCRFSSWSAGSAVWCTWTCPRSQTWQCFPCCRYQVNLRAWTLAFWVWPSDCQQAVWTMEMAGPSPVLVALLMVRWVICGAFRPVPLHRALLPTTVGTKLSFRKFLMERPRQPRDSDHWQFCHGAALYEGPPWWCGSVAEKRPVGPSRSCSSRQCLYHMEVDSSPTEACFAALEQQVQSLTAHQQQMELAIDEPAKRSDSQITALQTQVTSQIDAQGPSRACSRLNCNRSKPCSPRELLVTRVVASCNGFSFSLCSSGPTVCCGIPLWTGLVSVLCRAFVAFCWILVCCGFFRTFCPLASRLWCPQALTWRLELATVTWCPFRGADLKASMAFLMGNPSGFFGGLFCWSLCASVKRSIQALNGLSGLPTSMAWTPEPFAWPNLQSTRGCFPCQPSSSWSPFPLQVVCWWCPCRCEDRSQWNRPMVWSRGLVPVPNQEVASCVAWCCLPVGSVGLCLHLLPRDLGV